MRPRTLPAAVCPVLVGAALAYMDGAFSWLAALCALTLALLLQVAVNLANDYFDGVRGVDTDKRLGPTRVTQSGLISPARVRGAMIATLLACLAPGGYLIWLGGAPLLILGALAVISVLGYSGGPHPIASHALGDVFVFVFFGPVAVGGTYYAQTGALTALVWLCSCAVGCLITAVLVVNNLRDIPTDREVGKITLAVLLGEASTRRFYAALMLAPYVTLVAATLAGMVGPPALLPIASFPVTWQTLRGVNTAQGRELNHYLAATAKAALLFSTLLAGGLALS